MKNAGKETKEAAKDTGKAVGKTTKTDRAKGEARAPRRP